MRAPAVGAALLLVGVAMAHGRAAGQPFSTAGSSSSTAAPNRSTSLPTCTLERREPGRVVRAGAITHLTVKCLGLTGASGAEGRGAATIPPRFMGGRRVKIAWDADAGDVLPNFAEADLQVPYGDEAREVRVQATVRLLDASGAPSEPVVLARTLQVVPPHLKLELRLFAVSRCAPSFAGQPGHLAFEMECRHDEVASIHEDLSVGDFGPSCGLSQSGVRICPGSDDEAIGLLSCCLSAKGQIDTETGIVMLDVQSPASLRVEAQIVDGGAVAIHRAGAYRIDTVIPGYRGRVVLPIADGASYSVGSLTATPAGGTTQTFTLGLLR